MPGKYPLITAPERTRSTLTAGGSLGLSQSDTATLRGMFPNSPIYYSVPPPDAATPGTAQTDADYRAIAAGYLHPSSQDGDEDIFPGGVDLDYGDTPNFAGTLTVDGVEFDSPYYPNRNLTGVDPAGGEGVATGVLIEPNDNFGSGAVSVEDVNPSATAAIINDTSIVAAGRIAPLGRSGAGTSDTHSINPGADGVGDEGTIAVSSPPSA